MLAMAGKVDWWYHRRNCKGCERARRFLSRHGMAIRDETDARRHGVNAEEALDLARNGRTVISICRGRILRLTMAKKPSDEEVLRAILGPRGRLRAPSIRVGKTLVVGFDETEWSNVLGL